MVKGRDEEPKINGCLSSTYSISSRLGVIAEDEGPVEADTVSVEAINQRFVITHDHVQLLIHHLQRIVPERLKANQHSCTAALCHDFEKLFISRHIERLLSQLVNFLRSKLPNEISCMLVVSDEFV